jgi:hypothetical protein
MLATSLLTLLLPLWIVLGLGVLIGIFGLLARVDNGRYVRPVVTLITKVPLFRRWLQKASEAHIERTNPELASALKKLEPHQKHLHNPEHARKAMSRLTRQERAALLEMQDQQGAVPEEATNRQMRRQLEKQKKRR